MRPDQTAAASLAGAAGPRLRRRSGSPLDHPDIEWPTGELSCRVEPHGLLSGCVQAGAQGQRAEAVARPGQLVEFCPSELVESSWSLLSGRTEDVSARRKLTL